MILLVLIHEFKHGVQAVLMVTRLEVGQVFWQQELARPRAPWPVFRWLFQAMSLANGTPFTCPIHQRANLQVGLNVIVRAEDLQVFVGRKSLVDRIARSPTGPIPERYYFI